MNTQKTISLISAVLATATLTACSNTNTITVISREDGSGTRSAFTKLIGIAIDDTDNTVDTAEISNSTSVVIQSVIGNPYAIGYISLGSLNDDIKALSVDSVAPTAENVSNGSYKVSRPFNIAIRDDISELASDFVSFILSADGQELVEESGYISIHDGESYSPSGLEGTIVVAGSTSVAPVMEKLADKYMTINDDVNIEIQQTGSSAGMTSTIEGACDIGMASRDVKESEIEQGLIPYVIANDGIAVIVNTENNVTELTSQQIKDIYTGVITDWAELS